MVRRRLLMLLQLTAVVAMLLLPLLQVVQWEIRILLQLDCQCQERQIDQ